MYSEEDKFNYWKTEMKNEKFEKELWVIVQEKSYFIMIECDQVCLNETKKKSYKVRK